MIRILAIVAHILAILAHILAITIHLLAIPAHILAITIHILAILAHILAITIHILAIMERILAIPGQRGGKPPLYASAGRPIEPQVCAPRSPLHTSRLLTSLRYSKIPS